MLAASMGEGAGHCAADAGEQNTEVSTEAIALTRCGHAKLVSLGLWVVLAS